jgi:hypothetical protein
MKGPRQFERAGLRRNTVNVRAHRGWTAQAIGAPADGAIRCRFCGEAGHHGSTCAAPIRRGWGWPGWESELPPEPPETTDTALNARRPKKPKAKPKE